MGHKIIDLLGRLLFEAARVAQDIDGSEITDLEGNPLLVNSDGTVTLFHRTTPEAADQIRLHGFKRGKENTGDIYLSNRLKGQAKSFGKGIVKVKVLPKYLSLDDAFRDGEVHLTISPKHFDRLTVVEHKLRENLEQLSDECALLETRMSNSAAAAVMGAFKNPGYDYLTLGLDSGGNVVVDPANIRPTKFKDYIGKAAPVNLDIRTRKVVSLSKLNPAFSPHLHKLLKALVKFEPAISSFKFEGHLPITLDSFTVGEWLAMGFRQLPGKLPPMYHGTSSVFHDEISKKGLRPRGEGGHTSYDAGGSMPSNEDWLYLATSINPAIEAAHAAIAKHGGSAVIYQVDIPDSARLRADEDSAKWFGPDWRKSLKAHGTVAYEGRIPYRFVKPSMIRRVSGGSRRWLDWSGKLPSQ